MKINKMNNFKIFNVLVTQITVPFVFNGIKRGKE